MIEHSIRQSWPMPATLHPIVIFGAGSIVRDAHLPAYQALKFPIAGVYDPDNDKARNIGEMYNVPVFSSVSEASSQSDVVFDIATPPSAHMDVLNDSSFKLVLKLISNHIVADHFEVNCITC